MVLQRGDAFLADDWCFLSAEGDVLGYAKPLFVRAHHRALLPHLFAESRKPLASGTLARPLAGVATAVHPAIAGRPQIARVARRWSPEHMIVPVAEALPGAAIATAAPLSATIFVERRDDARARLEPRDADWMATRLIGSFHAELPRGARDLLTALGAVGLLSLDRFFADKAGVLARALERRPAYLLSVPRALAAEAAADAIASAVDAVIPEQEEPAACSTCR
jgi:hypothetical protein